MTDAGVTEVRQGPGAARIHRDNRGVVVSRVEDLTRGREREGTTIVNGNITRVILARVDGEVTARERHRAEGSIDAIEHQVTRVDGDTTREGQEARRIEGLRARTHLGEAQGISSLFGQRTREGAILIIRTKVQVTGVRKRRDRARATQATDDFGAGRHH